MRQILSCAAALAMIWLSLAGAQTTQKKAAPTKTAAPATKKAAAPAAHKGATTAAASKKGTATRKTAVRRPAVTWRNRQMAPSQERYQEIQSALVARGFLNSEDATGNWNQTSIDALKRFQAQQNLESSGKINSLSLIALGLGPKHETPVMPTRSQVEQSGQ
jgi:hypothetical protein